MRTENWTVLLYLCGDTSKDLADRIAANVEQVRKVRLTDRLTVGLQVDFRTGATRSTFRPGQRPEDEPLGAVNSGSSDALRQFVTWGLKELPADHFALIIGGTGMFDPNSVVGHPDQNWTDIFAICDDTTAHDALEIAELRTVLESALDEAAMDRFAIVAFDMCRMQFLEVNYELELVTDVVIGVQTMARCGWDYELVLQSWQEALSDPERNPTVAEIASHVVQNAGKSYAASNEPEVVLTAVRLRRLEDLTRDFDAFALAYMQALGDWIAWEARRAVADAAGLARTSAYDLRDLLEAIQRELVSLLDEKLSLWIGRLLSSADTARRSEYALGLERMCVRQRAQGDRTLLRAERAPGDTNAVIEACIGELRNIRRRAASSQNVDAIGPVQLPEGISNTGHNVWETCFAAGGLPDRLQEEYAILQHERERAVYLVKLAGRVMRHFLPEPSEFNLIVDKYGSGGGCGVSLYRPLSLDRLVDSNYLKLEFSKRVHWAALLGAINLIGSDQRALWRVISSMLASADPRGRDDLLERLSGRSSVAASYRGQFRALAGSPTVTLSLEPATDQIGIPASSLTDMYRLRLESARRDATLIEHLTPVNPSTVEGALKGLERLLRQGRVSSDDFEAIESFGRTLGEDVMQDLASALNEERALVPDRQLHLQLQLPARLMKYPWELMHDGEQWLSERYALGRQVFVEQGAVRSATRFRTGGLRLLVIGDPVLHVGGYRQLPGARDEADHVASLFERLQDQVGAAVEFDRRRDARIHQVFTRQDCRRALRDGKYDVVHFAGHGFFDNDQPHRSGWVLSDGPLWAQEIRNTLMRSAAPPWLIYANACEAAMNEAKPNPKYHGDVYGLASAFINKGVGAYVAPLWAIDDGMAMKIAADFYTLLMLDRMTVGEALCHAKRRAKEAVFGRGAFPAVVNVPAYMGLSWASLILYRDPAQTIVHQLAARNDRPNVSILARPPENGRRRRSAPLHGDVPLQASPSALIEAMDAPGMRPLDRLRGPTENKTGEQQLAVVERGGIRYWATVTEAGAVPLSDGGIPAIAEKAEKQLQQDRGFSDYLKIVGRWATGRLDGELVGDLVRQYDATVVPSEGLLVVDRFSGELRPFVPADAKVPPLGLQNDKYLLLIHGTFSKSAAPLAGLGPAFVEWAHRQYRHILAFDHWTLSRSPLENAEMLWRELPGIVKSTPKSLDIITHSRGGLVARALIQLQLDGAPPPVEVAKSVRHVVFVGTPNFGTALADENNWSRAADLLLNLIHLDGLGLYGKLSGLLARLALSRLSAELQNRIPGLQAQNPTARKNGQFLGDLLNASVPADVGVSAIASNYEPRRDEAHLKFVAQSAGDAAVDAFFDGFNDLVVNTTNVWLDSVLSTGSERARLVKGENLLVISPRESGLVSDAAQKASLYGVHHTNLFTIEETREFLVRQLRQ